MQEVTDLRAAVGALQGEKAELTAQLGDSVAELKRLSEELEAGSAKAGQRESDLQKVRTLSHWRAVASVTEVPPKGCTAYDSQAHHLAHTGSVRNHVISDGFKMLFQLVAVLDVGSHSYPHDICLQDLHAAEESLRLALREHEETAGNSRDQAFTLQVRFSARRWLRSTSNL